MSSLRRYLAACVAAIAAMAASPGTATADGGDFDHSFGAKGKVRFETDVGGEAATDVAIQPDGKIVLAGWANDFYQPHFSVVRLRGNGKRDKGFGGDGIVKTYFGNQTARAEGVAIQPNGRIVVAGADRVARYMRDGHLDDSFAGNGKLHVDVPQLGGGVSDVIVQPGHRIVLAASTPDEDALLVGLEPNGDLDETFGDAGTAVADLGGDDVPAAMASQPDGSIVAVGRSGEDTALVRFSGDGVLDTGFADEGAFVADLGDGKLDGGSDVVVRGDGRIVASATVRVGSGSDMAALRLTSGGEPDGTFGDGGVALLDVAGSPTAGSAGAHAVALGGGGRILIAGTTGDGDEVVERMVVARLEPDGDLDPDFSADGIRAIEFPGGGGASAHALAVQEDGRIVAAGLAGDQLYEPDSDFAAVRLLGS